MIYIVLQSHAQNNKKTFRTFGGRINEKNLGQYCRPRVLGCEPVDGVLVVLSSTELNIATFVHPMGDVC